ncbi:MAG: hypothetical protein ACK44W_06510 [Planctomycetota bacterium]
MRTVTFSHPKVAQRVNASFVPVWYNRGRDFHNCEKQTESWIFRSYAECYPTKNICTFFLTPDLEVVYYIAGYFAPELFLEVLDDVAELQAAGRAARSEHHRRIAERLAACKKACAPFQYENMEHRHEDAKRCQEIVTEAFQYRRRVHEALASDPSIPFERVQLDYLYGNRFTEESPERPAIPTGLARPQVPPGPSAAATPGGRKIDR